MSKDREKVIIRTSIISILINVILVLFKMSIGLLTHSIAVILDAVNNLSDALSSVITIVGTKLAGRAADEKHPYGYGRIEYLTSVLIAMIVMFAGFISLKESAPKIIHPEAADYSITSLIIISVAIIVKLACGRYVKSVGEKINSNSLIASGTEGLFDAVLSLATLFAALISMTMHISLEGILGAVISVLILKAGYEVLAETLDNIIGVRADTELALKIKKRINSFEGVRGAYDLTLHNYGPADVIASVHIEVEDHMTAREIHALTRRIMIDIMNEFGIEITVGIYASNTSGESSEVRIKVAKVVNKYEGILQMHGFYMDQEWKLIMFDIVMDFSVDHEQVRTQVMKDVERMFPGYKVDVIVDISYSD